MVLELAGLASASLSLSRVCEVVRTMATGREHWLEPGPDNTQPLKLNSSANTTTNHCLPPTLYTHGFWSVVIPP